MTGLYAVVIPTVGRPSLRAVLEALAAGEGPRPAEVVVVDDRRLLPLVSGKWCSNTIRHSRALFPVRVLRSGGHGGRGPAAARNVGWRAVDTEWVAFLDDDVVPAPDWPARLHADLANLPPGVGGSQGRIEVPLPTDRRPTDHERGTAGLATARWITADMAYRRDALRAVGGFDERFPRAYREDADLALRVAAAGYSLVRGRRRTVHPVRTAGFFASVRAQTGNADNALMHRRHGPCWRLAAGEVPGRLRQHAMITAAAVAAAGLCATRHPRLARFAALAWAALTAEFAAHRILPGPRTPSEIARMLVTSVVIPPVACVHRLAGELRWARVPRTGVPDASTAGVRSTVLLGDVGETCQRGLAMASGRTGF